VVQGGPLGVAHLAMRAPRRATNADDSGTIQEKVDGAERRLHQLVNFRG
jgi:hypothetical protein